MSGLNLSTEEKDMYIISADPWGNFEIESDHIKYVTTKGFEGLQCRNQSNEKELKKKCSKVLKLIEEIEQLNK